MNMKWQIFALTKNSMVKIMQMYLLANILSEIGRSGHRSHEPLMAEVPAGDRGPGAHVV